MKTSIALCHMPKRLDALHTELYQKVRHLHCDKDRESHECQGRVTIDRNGITLSCPLCGDARSTYTEKELVD